MFADLKAAVGDIQRRVDRLLIVGVAFLDLLHGPSALIGELDVRSHGVCRAAVGDLHTDPDLDHLLTADGLDTQGAELQVLHSQLRLALDFPDNTAVQRAVFEGRIDIFSVFAHGEVDLASHEILRQRFGIIVGVQLGGHRLTHRDVFVDLPLKELFACAVAIWAGDAQLHSDGIGFGTTQRDVAGVFEGHHGTQPRAGHKVGRLEGDAGLAHTLFAYAEGQDIDAGGGGHSTIVVVLAGDDLCARFAVELSFLQLGLGAPGQNDQRGLIHFGCVGCGHRAFRASRAFRSFGCLRQTQRHCQITEGEGGHQAPIVRLIALQLAVVGLLGLLGVPTVGDGVLIDLHLVHGQHAALAEFLGVCVILGDIDGVVGGIGNGAGVHGRDVAVAVHADVHAAPSAVLLCGGKEGNDIACPGGAALGGIRDGCQTRFGDHIGRAVHLEQQEQAYRTHSLNKAQTLTECLRIPIPGQIA